MRPVVSGKDLDELRTGYDLVQGLWAALAADDDFEVAELVLPASVQNSGLADRGSQLGSVMAWG